MCKTRTSHFLEMGSKHSQACVFRTAKIDVEERGSESEEQVNKADGASGYFRFVISGHDLSAIFVQHLPSIGVPKLPRRRSI